jgi:hypothetical protein
MRMARFYRKRRDIRPVWSAYESNHCPVVHVKRRLSATWPFLDTNVSICLSVHKIPFREMSPEQRFCLL